MKKTILRKYAKLAVRTGVNLKKGQGCAIYAQVEQHEFAELVAEEAYRAGAKWVQVFWQDQAVRKLDLRHQTVTQLSKVEEWEKVQQQMFVDQLPARIHIESADPDGLKGVSVPKMQKAQAARSTVLRPYRKAIDNKHQWTIIAVPSKKWAKKVFPGERASAAVFLFVMIKCSFRFCFVWLPTTPPAGCFDRLPSGSHRVGLVLVAGAVRGAAVQNIG